MALRYDRVPVEDFKAYGGERLLKSFGELWFNPKGANLTIKCADKLWRVHKLIVCGQCDFFDRACKDGFKEGQTNTITFSDDDPDMIHAMLYFFYHYNYEHSDTSEQLVVHALVYAVADKYGVDGLAELSKRKFVEAKNQFPLRHDLQSAIRLVYSTTPPQNKGLRDVIVEWLTASGGKRFRELMAVPGFPEIMADAGELGRDIAANLASQLATRLSSR